MSPGLEPTFKGPGEAVFAIRCMKLKDIVGKKLNVNMSNALKLLFVYFCF